jgi:ABC-2 type transport system permease protein
MIRLVRTELTRLRWRRAVIVLFAAAVVVPLLIAIGTVWETRPYSEAEIAQGREAAQAQPGFHKEVRRCEKHPRRFGVRDASACEDQVTQWWSNLYRQPLDLRSELRDSSIGAASVVLALLVLVGTTFAGADWASGSMSNQLLFEPRRLRVWLAKGIAVGLVAVLLATVVMTLYWSVLYGAAASRGIDVPTGLTGEVAWQVARCAFLATVGAATGYALTMLSRSTVFTLGTVFALSAAGSLLVAALPLGDDEGRWFPGTNLLAVMQGRATYFRPPPAECSAPGADPATWDAAMQMACNGTGVLTIWQGLAYMAAPVVLVAVLSVWSFRRRDVP